MINSDINFYKENYSRTKLEALLSAYAPDFEYVMIDLTQYSDEKIKSFLEKSASREKGEFIMTTMERWMNEGDENAMKDTEKLIKIAEKLIKNAERSIKNAERSIQIAERSIQIEAIQMGLMIKFKDQYQKFMAIINKIEDIEKLKQIKQALIKVKDEYEFLKLIEQ